MLKDRVKKNDAGLLCAYALIIFLACFIIISCNRNEKNENEIYSYHGQKVELSADGSFTASLSHGVKKSGTYTKKSENNSVIISFNVDGNLEVGRIIDDSLHLPKEWDDGHGHGSVFPKTNAAPSSHEDGHNH